MKYLSVHVSLELLRFQDVMELDDLQCVPSSHSSMLVCRPVVAGGCDCVLGIGQTAVVSMETGWRIITRTAIASTESLANDKRPIHYYAEISIPPAQAHMGKSVFGRHGRRLCKAGWDVLQPGLYAFLVELYELFSAGEWLANHSGVDIIRSEMEGSLYANSSIWRNV